MGHGSQILSPRGLGNWICSIRKRMNNLPTEVVQYEGTLITCSLSLFLTNRELGGTSYHVGFLFPLFHNHGGKMASVPLKAVRKGIFQGKEQTLSTGWNTLSKLVWLPLTQNHSKLYPTHRNGWSAYVLFTSMKLFLPLYLHEMKLQLSYQRALVLFASPKILLCINNHISFQ